MIHKMREKEFSDIKTFKKWLIETMKRKILKKNESNAFVYWNEIFKQQIEYKINN